MAYVRQGLWADRKLVPPWVGLAGVLMWRLNGEISIHCRTCRQKTALSILSQIRRLT